ncbi:helix-turn-helix domain-containing protein [Holdemanella biformis]|uniref:helix-turn-helix domain-containing protein n=1 Tax=Holdemanella biformis TaxID=1735 RepID=UPI00216B008F|nr:helix-turn-helix transcriptional regulator [Holdemanella biformis]
MRISHYENGTRVPRKDMLGKISKALHINSMYLNMNDHTEALDFVFTLLDWDRTTDFIIKKETIDKENHYLIDLNTNLFDDFLEAWIQKKPI